MVQYVGYHMNWPSPGNDPWYAANPTQSLARRNYYSVNATPTFKMDGATVSASLTSVTNAYNTRRNVPSPLWFEMSARLNNTTQNLELTVRSVASSPIPASPIYRMKAMIVEIEERWSPPAPNGQTLFEYPFIANAPNTDGVAYTHSGLTTDTLTNVFVFQQRTTGLEPFTLDNCGFIVYVQKEDATKEIQQTGFLRMPLDFPNLAVSAGSGVDVGGNNDGRIEPGESGTLTAALSNGIYFADATNVVATLRTTSPGITITDSVAIYGTVAHGATVRNTTDTWGITVDATAPVQWATFNVSISADNNYSGSGSFQIRIGRPGLLLVQADSVYDFSGQYTGSLQTMNVQYDLWDMDMALLTAADLARYSKVIWFTGITTSEVLSDYDRTLIRGYIDTPGKSILISSQNALEYCVGTDTAFVSNYLRANLVNPRVSAYTLAGVAGDPYFNGVSIRTAGAGGAGNADQSTTMTATNGAVAAFQFTTRPGEYGALYYTTNTTPSSKVMFMSVPLEAISGTSGTNTREVFLQRVFDFMNGTTSSPEPVENTPSGFVLSEAFPNPFNPTTVVKLSLASATQVRAAVFDAAGREVVKLLDARRAVAGELSLTVDLTSQPSGIYFLRVEANGEVAVRKLALMK